MWGALSAGGPSLLNNQKVQRSAVLMPAQSPAGLSCAGVTEGSHLLLRVAEQRKGEQTSGHAKMLADGMTLCQQVHFASLLHIQSFKGSPPRHGHTSERQSRSPKLQYSAKSQVTCSCTVHQTVPSHGAFT